MRCPRSSRLKAHYAASRARRHFRLDMQTRSDANIAADENQYQWIKGQLEGLDRTRYVNVMVFCHQAPFSSGPHGGSPVEDPTREPRARYMPLFNTHRVRVVFSGHEHLFEHWVEHYTDASGSHRMDLIVSGGGGAPIYNYTGEPVASKECSYSGVVTSRCLLA